MPKKSGRSPKILELLASNSKDFLTVPGLIFFLTAFSEGGIPFCYRFIWKGYYRKELTLFKISFAMAHCSSGFVTDRRELS